LETRKREEKECFSFGNINFYKVLILLNHST
jgi:hypothetical protein